MSTSKEVDDVHYNYPSWQNIMEEAKAATVNVSLMKDRLTTHIVVPAFENYFLKKPIEQKTKAEDEEEYVIMRKQKKQKTGNIEKKTKSEDEKEYVIMRKQKKQKTCNIEKKQKGKEKQKPKAASNGKKKQIQKRDDETELASLGLIPPPDMPEEFKNCIAELGGTDIKLLLQKFIERTDLTKQHNRLSMSTKRLKKTFLSEDEEQMLKNKIGMEVTVVEPRLEVSNLNLTMWTIGGSSTYVFKTQWHQLVLNNADSLKPKAVVQIWSFRIPPDSKLGFALIKVRDGEDSHIIED